MDRNHLFLAEGKGAASSILSSIVSFFFSPAVCNREVASVEGESDVDFLERIST